MWKPLAAVAALALVPCAYAQVPAPAVPLTLDAAIERVAQDHPALGWVDARRPALEAGRTLAAVTPPLQLGVTVEDVFGTGQARALRAMETTVTLSGVIERGGKLDARRLLAQANLDALAPQRATARLDLMAETARRYLAIARAQADLRVAELDITQRQRAVDAARARLRAGASPESVLFTAQAQLAQAELDRDRALQSAQGAGVALAALWGGRGADVGRVSGDVLLLPDVVPLEVLAQTLDASPELAEVMGQQRIAQAQLQLAQADAAPDWSWQLGLRGNRADNDVAWVAGVSVPLGLRARAAPAISMAQAQLAAVPFQQQALQRQLYATLADAHGRYVGARLEVLRLEQDVVGKLQRAEQAAQRAWQLGAASYMEWAQLQAMRVDVHRRQVDSAAAAQAALIEIQRLTGRALLADAPTQEMSR